jgi:KDO2-lipid IV(A) lauroyltransferase
MKLKDIAGKASYQLVKFILLLTRIIPLRMTYALISLIVTVGSVFKWKRRQIALNNIKIVFPDMALKARKELFRESFRNMLKNYFEMAYIFNGRYGSEKIIEMATATGLEQLDRLKSDGKGAIFYSGHFGNFPLMTTWLAIKGYPVAVIYKEAKYFPDDFFANIMRKYNVTPLKYNSESGLTMTIIRALKEKKIVLILNDQSHPRGIYIKFFNKNVPSPAGPALLAKRTGVPIIPGYVFRDEGNHHKITVLPEIHLQQIDDHEQFMQVNTQLLIDWIADILVRHPTEWLWLHNRWKRAKETDEQ